MCVCDVCVCELCVSTLCVRELRGNRGGAAGSTQPKTRTPHKDVGNNRWFGGVSPEHIIAKKRIWKPYDRIVNKNK